MTGETSEQTAQQPGDSDDRNRATRRSVLKAGLAAGVIAGTGAWRFAPGHTVAQAAAAGTGPYSVAGTTVPSGASSYSVAVQHAVPAGDGLVVAVALGGASPPAVSSVTDSKGNTYIPLQRGSSASPHLAVFSPAANGS